MAVLQEWVTEKETNGIEMRIKSAKGEQTAKDMETCAYNTGYYEWLCVRKTRRIISLYRI